MKIVIPSRGRPHGSTLELLKKEQFNQNEVFVIIREEELNDYQESLKDYNFSLIIVPNIQLDDGSTRQLGINYIKTHYPEETRIVFIDDDVKGVRGKSFISASKYLNWLLTIAQKTHPRMWILTSLQDNKFLPKKEIRVNAGTPWITLCAIDLTLMPEEGIQSTLEYGPQEIVIPINTFKNNLEYGITGAMFYYPQLDFSGGISIALGTEDRNVREEHYYNTCKTLYSEEFLLIKHYDNDYMVRLNVPKLRKAMNIKTTSIKLKEEELFR